MGLYAKRKGELLEGSKQGKIRELMERDIITGRKLVEAVTVI